MPVKMSYSETCSQKDTSEYYSYENDVVYQLTIIKKSKTIPIFCPQPIKFNKDIYDQRILKWTQESVSKSSISVKIGNMTALEFALAYRKIWVFNDMSHDRWIEIVINPREAAIFDTSKFLNSIDLDRKNNGIDIGDGAIEMLGDGSVTPVLVISETPNLSQSATEIKKVATDGLRIVAKPKPAYTDQARKKLEQGHVLLRVAFLANGRIGSISVING